MDLRSFKLLRCFFVFQDIHSLSHRIQKQVDKNFVKAEKQRLRAEKKQRKAEVKELKKQLKLHRKIHLWNSIHGLQSPRSPLGRPESLLQSNALM